MPELNVGTVSRDMYVRQMVVNSHFMCPCAHVLMCSCAHVPVCERVAYDMNLGS
jgi:hypothetical protein